MSTFTDTTALCPFYKASENQKIRCEGVIPEAISATTMFKNNTDRDAILEQCCNNNYKLCPMYWAINKKYERR